ncbi:unnamed protein product [Closterium sp. NIES-53]
MAAGNVIGWLDKAVAPFIKPKFGVQGRSALLVLDSYRGHLTKEVKKKFAEYNVILAGCTAKVQSLDVAINKKLQGIGAAAVTELVLTSSPLLFNLRAGNIKKLPPAVVLKWVSKAWRTVPAELIKKALLTCSISNALDDSEDKLSMAHRRSQMTHEVDVDDEIQVDGFSGNNCQEPESDEEE